MSRKRVKKPRGRGFNPSINIQKQIKDNANDLRDFVSDLYKWEDGHDVLEK